MVKITEKEANIIKKSIGNDFELSSSFTHIKGISMLTANWTHIITEYDYKCFRLKIETIKEYEDSPEITNYYLKVIE